MLKVTCMIQTSPVYKETYKLSLDLLKINLLLLVSNILVRLSYKSVNFTFEVYCCVIITPNIP